MKLPSPRRSLRLKLILAIVSVQVLVFAALVANGVRLIENQLLDQARTRVAELMPVLNAALAGPLAELDYATLQAILDDTQRDNGVSYLALFNQKGIVAVSGWDMRKPLPSAETEIQVGRADGDSRYDGMITIHLNGHHYGVLRFGISTDFLSVATAQLMRQSAIIAMLGIILSAGLLAGLGYWLTRHLARLTRASQQVTSGDFSISVPIETEDEIGELAGAFNLMSEVIRKRIEQLQQAEEIQKVLVAQTQQEQARLASLLSAMNVGILFESADGRIIYVNPACRQIWSIDVSLELAGQPTQEVLGSRARLLAQADETFSVVVQDPDLKEECAARDIAMPDGRLLTQICYPVVDKGLSLIGRLWIFEDVTHERQTAERLIYLAERDSLTGLYNRHRFHEALTQMLAAAQRGDLRGALLFLDLDGFKYINDSYGHRVGDSVLIRVANTVSTLVRRHEVLSRLGGDEFAVLVPNASEEDVARLAERIVQAIAEIQFQLDGQPLHLTASLGLAFYPEHGISGEELISHADIAMYQAKDAGKNT